MNKARLSFLLIIVLSGGVVVLLLYLEKFKTPLDSTLAPAFTLMGKMTHSINRSLTHVVPVSELDEKKYGDAIYERYGQYSESNSRIKKYLEDLLKHVSLRKKKKFSYRVILLSDPSPNAYAMPGGVILVTDGLLGALRNEAELVSVLAHELGHVERNHCLDAVRFELLFRKIGSAPLGQIADIAVSFLMRHSYNKTQEDEADEYAYQLIENTEYNPSGVAGAFQSLIDYYGVKLVHKESAQTFVFKEYFMTHPHLEHRVAKYKNKSIQWWKMNQNAKRYTGKGNLEEKKSFYSLKIPSEWTTTGSY